MTPSRWAWLTAVEASVEQGEMADVEGRPFFLQSCNIWPLIGGKIFTELNRRRILRFICCVVGRFCDPICLNRLRLHW